MVVCSPVSRLLTRAVTPSESCSNDISSVENRRSPPCARALSSSTGSRSFWLHRHQPLGLKRASPPPGSISLNSHSPTSPTRLGVCRMPWLSARTDAASSMRRSTPATRNNSMVRTLFPRPRGWTEVPEWRSTSVCGTPRRPRNREVDRPTREPPTIRTGVWWPPVPSASSARFIECLQCLPVSAVSAGTRVSDGSPLHSASPGAVPPAGGTRMAHGSPARPRGSRGPGDSRQLSAHGGPGFGHDGRCPPSTTKAFHDEEERCAG